jgi:ferredoxin
VLLLVGNTLEHYGIFTLDKAHANHDHSKNNKEHVDVWASNEETLRIGTPADKDIYGNSVNPVFASYVSGFDQTKDNNHFHYAEVSTKDFDKRSSISYLFSWLIIALGLTGTGIIIIRFKSLPSNHVIQQHKGGLNLLKINWLKRFVTWRYFRHIFIIPILILFLIIIYFGFFDVQDGKRNIATVFTWTLWWSLIIFTFVIAGRFWCMMCPIAALGDFVQKLVSLNRKLPPWLQNMGFQTLAFILLTWAFTIMAFSSKPLITVSVVVFILIAAIVFSMIYQRRSFCRHICPIGAVIGIYSMVSPLELRASDKNSCTSHKQKTCNDVCPMLESPNDLDNNIYCNFCMKCKSACPASNLTLNLRTFGKDIYARLHRSPAEAIAALFLLGVTIVETFAMTSSWRPLESKLSALIGISSSSILYTIIFTLVILIPVGGFYLICYSLKLWLGKGKYETQNLVTKFAFLFIPLGISLHLAHNIQHLLLEGPIVVPSTLRFLRGVLK